ncbi:hypothetical protein RCH20_001042 [Psychrobacter sp. PL15]|uniref:hypothetical protein n=1 Tax=Psychrobacter sp. PL15 TaxID=3071719 RepID=UPI002DFE3112|nr:hypothetical protein [Psychrobacter sp. PL15]
MSIIDQLEQTVTPAVLGANSSVAYLSLLEQFYAILITRLVVPEIYTQLQRSDSLVETATSSTLFEQLWQQSSQRHLLIQELASTHHIDETTTEQLVIKAAYLAYQALKKSANGQFLPAFLQTQQSDIRQYLPVWTSAVVMPVIAVATEEAKVLLEEPTYINKQAPNTAVAAEQALATDDLPLIIETNAGATPVATDAIHANPSAYHGPEMRAEIRSRNQHNNLLLRWSLLGGALLAIALVWALFFRNDAESVPPIVVTPVVTTPEIVTPKSVLTPVQLMVAVDDSGNLYSCSAMVGDVNLQTSLKQALMVSFSGQSSICEVTIQKGLATTLANMSIATLPDILTLMRTVPFSRLQLQNDSISLEAPNDVLLQRLLIDMRTLLPAMTITTATPSAIVQPPANTYDDTHNNNNNNNNNNSNYNDDYNNNIGMQDSGSRPITSDNNLITNQPNQPPVNNTSNNLNSNVNSNSIEPTLPPPQSSINNNNNRSQNNQPAQSSGQMSLAEADEIANATIISEPAQGGRPINQ